MSLSLRTSRCAGLTLPEVLLASAVLAFAVAALSQAMMVAQGQVHGAVDETRAVSLLEATMAEVMRLPYADPEDGTAYHAGPEAGETLRTGYDNLDDYHGWSQNAGALTDFAEVAYPAEYARFSRSVQVTPANAFVELFGASYSGVRVVVSVSDDTGRAWTLEREVPLKQD